MLFYSLMDLIEGEMTFPIFILDITFSFVALLLSFSVHECAHGLTAYAFGDPTAKEQGRLTLNPIKHIDPIGFLMIMLLGFGWAKPVQFNPNNFKNRRLSIICTAVAGPLSNVILCFIGCLLFEILSRYASLHEIVWLAYFSVFFMYLAMFNASLAIFNMIPFPPLDGSKVVGELLPFNAKYRYYGLERYSKFFFIALIILLRLFNFIAILSDGLLNLFEPLAQLIVGGVIPT